MCVGGQMSCKIIAPTDVVSKNHFDNRRKKIYRCLSLEIVSNYIHCTFFIMNYYKFKGDLYSIKNQTTSNENFKKKN